FRSSPRRARGYEDVGKPRDHWPETIRRPYSHSSTAKPTAPRQPTLAAIPCVWLGPCLPPSTMTRRLKEPTAFGTWTEDRAHELLELKVELYDHVVGAGRQSETGTDIVLDTVGKLAPNHREDVMLLLANRVVVINQPDPPVKFDARR